MKTKKKAQREKPAELDQEYVDFFQPRPLPFQGILTENDSLEQPSPLKDYPSLSTPGVGVSVELHLGRYAKLEPDIH